MTVHEDRAGAKLGCGSQGHSGMHTKFTRFIRCSRDYSTLVAMASDYYCLPFQRRNVKLFHREKEGIHVDVEDGFGGCKNLGTTLAFETTLSAEPKTTRIYGLTLNSNPTEQS